jgi:uncharacterized protein (TIGR03000 family)
MARSLRLVLLGILGLSVTPDIGVAQQSYPAVRRLFSNQPLTGQEIENHLRAYNRGTLNPYQGIGYSHSGGYGFGGGNGFYYGGAFFPPTYGMTNGLYPYRSIYSYPSNDSVPLPVISRPNANPSVPFSTAEGISAVIPQAAVPATPDGQPQAFPLATPGVPLVESAPAPAVRPAAPVAPRAATNVATIRVLLPDASAKVLLDGRPTASTGRERTYFSPPLAPNGKYVYDIVATWSSGGAPVSVSRSVIVIPGETMIVDLTRSDETRPDSAAN